MPRKAPLPAPVPVSPLVAEQYPPAAVLVAHVLDTFEALTEAQRPAYARLVLFTEDRSPEHAKMVRHPEVDDWLARYIEAEP